MCQYMICNWNSFNRNGIFIKNVRHRIHQSCVYVFAFVAAHFVFCRKKSRFRLRFTFVIEWFYVIMVGSMDRVQIHVHFPFVSFSFSTYLKGNNSLLEKLLIFNRFIFFVIMCVYCVFCMLSFFFLLLFHFLFIGNMPKWFRILLQTKTAVKIRHESILSLTTDSKWKM